MKPRKFSLRSLTSWLFKKRLVNPVVLTSQTRPQTSARERIRNGIEPLEGRIAPAILLNGHTLTYNDSDGDSVRVTFSSDIFDMTQVTLPDALTQVFKFSAGKAHTGTANATDDVPQQLQLIDLGKVPTKLVGGVATSRVAGVSFTISSEVNPGSGLPPGDGLAAIGAINAGANGLGTVIVDGDLGQIDAGTGRSKVGIGVLVAQSIGKFGTTTQAASPTPDLNSVIAGRLGRLVVFDDVQGYIHVVDATVGTAITQRGTINQITIRGSLIGDPTVATTSDNSGRIESSFDIGSVLIGTDAADGVFGGGGRNSGAITAVHAIGSITTTGNIEGGAGEGSGVIASGGTIGLVKIGGDLKGAAGLRSGGVRSGTAIGDVAIGSTFSSHDIVGGAGESSGVIFSGGTVGNVHVFGDVTGGGLRAGGLLAGGNIKSVIVDGNLTGAAAPGSGVIESQRAIGPALIAGDVIGGDGAGSGAVVAGSALARITVLGDVSGGKGLGSGAILGGHDPTSTVRSLGNVTLGGALIGGEGISSGEIHSGGTIAAVRIGTTLQNGAAIQGGSGASSGTVSADGGIVSVTTLRGISGSSGAGSASIHAEGLLGSVAISGDVVGGSGAGSASIFARENAAAARPIAGDIGSVSITGKLMGAGDRTALVQADGILGRATIGAIQGGAGVWSGAIMSGAGFVRPGATASIAIAGLVEGGVGERSGSIEIGGRLASLAVGGFQGADVRVANDLGLLRVNGDVIDSAITARGQAIRGTTTDVAIGAVTIAGNVLNSTIRAGLDTDGIAVNADAQIGGVRVTGSWTSSVLAAGTVAGVDVLFGTADDTLIVGANNSRIIAQIASVIIGGAVNGTAAGGDHFGFIAQRIGAFSANGVAQPLTAAGGQAFEVGATGDTTVREVLA